MSPNIAGILQLEHPNIALSVKTKLALLNVLSAQHEGVEQLKAEGVLSVSDCELLIKVRPRTGWRWGAADGGVSTRGSVQCESNWLKTAKAAGPSL